MALKQLDTNYYIKLDLDGTFKVYAASEDRNAEKLAPSFTQVSAKYQQIIRSLWADKERLYYEPGFREHIIMWETEYSHYLRMHAQGLKQGNFPLIKQYFDNLEDSLPKLLFRGRVGLRNVTTLQEAYSQAKYFDYFGDVEDC